MALQIASVSQYIEDGSKPFLSPKKSTQYSQYCFISIFSYENEMIEFPKYYFGPFKYIQ